MKKKLFFLMTLALIVLSNTPVKAESYNFYEAEYISNIYMNRAPLRGSNVIYYQKARYFRNRNTNAFAYCIEPFKTFNESVSYNPTINPNKLSPDKIERLSQIAHFGYGYKNHQEEKWYAITQFMIWKEADPEGDYYFTDTLNGKRTEKFTSEMNEIYNLINNYNKTPSFSNNTYDLVEENSLKLIDNNNVLNNYKILNQTNNMFLNNNQLEITNLKEGNYTLNLERQETVYNKPALFYQSNTSQDLIETGDINKKEIKLNINVQKTSLIINKKDKDTNSITPSGDAKLEDSIFNIYNSEMILIDKYKINKNKKIELTNLAYGTYYIQEDKPGTGYNKNDELFKVEINKTNPNLELDIFNEVIKSKIKINKLYGSNNTFQNEPNISFNIFNSKGELVKTITTNNEGIAEIILPYGEYTIEQLTTTEGYEKIAKQTIKIIDNKDINLEFKDYKIQVPNTKSNKNIFEKIILFIKKLLC